MRLMLICLSVALCAGLAGPAWGQAPSTTAGEEIYASTCASCHRTNGEGLAAAFPALKGSAFVQGDPQPVIQLILEGRKGSIGRMPAWKNKLDDTQVAAVITYIRQAWGNSAGAVSPEAVKALKK